MADWDIDSTLHQHSTPRLCYSFIDTITMLINSGVSNELLLRYISQNTTALDSLLGCHELEYKHITPLLSILTHACLRYDQHFHDQIYSNLLTSNFISPNGPLLDHTFDVIHDNEHMVVVEPSYLQYITNMISLFSSLHNIDSDNRRAKSNLDNSIQLFCNAVKESSSFYSIMESIEERIDKLLALCNDIKYEDLHYQFTDDRFYGYSHRHMSILPLPGEVQYRPRRSLRSLVKKGAYPDAETFLDVHFKLLREDMIRPIRQGVNNFFNNDKEFKKDLFVYSIDISRIRWDRSKRLMFGTLLLLFPMDSIPGEEVTLCDPLWAIVVNKDDKKITNVCARGNRNPNITIQFDSGFESRFSYDRRYYMLESRKVYYEAYKHTLSVLQFMDSGSLPFQKILLGQSSTNLPPRYVSKQTAYPMTNLFPSFRAHQLRVLGIWPDHSPIMDQSQYRAVKLALTSQLAVIQGPPGTGKTYVGTHVIKVLLEARRNLQDSITNRRNHYWRRYRHFRDNDEEDDPVYDNLVSTLCDKPIVVITYTNHALDQFLGLILEFENNIIRIGNRSEDEKIKKLSLRNKRDMRAGSLRYDQRKDINYELTIVSKRLQTISRRLASVQMTEYDIEYYTTPKQYKKLINHPKYSISDWYNCRDCNSKQTSVIITAAPIIPVVNNSETENFEVFSDSENEDAVDFNDDLIGYVSDDEFISSHDALYEGEFKPAIPIRDNICKFEAFADPWTLDPRTRTGLIDYWLSLKRECLSDQLERAKSDYEQLNSELKHHYLTIDYSALKQAAVVGMTTTGAAKNSELIQELKPHIIFIEESAEVLEAHVIGCLSESVQHLISIGDHKQLRPSFAEFSLLRHNLDISLFERLINNNFEHVTLQCQHRMRPEISQLVRHIYPHLIDDDTVFEYPSIKGARFNMFFIDHKIIEDRIDTEGLSKLNSHEAKFLAKLSEYLLNQGYKDTEITILTFYEAQKFSIKDELYKISKTIRIRVSTVDKYQGEENRIILFSAVRSNNENNIGHCRTDNRVCVALSRAREGLYLIGNSHCLREGGKRTGLWDKILDTFSNKLGPSLPLSCQNHPYKITNVSCSGDFNKVPLGGCDLPCDQIKPCGHKCTLKCHPYSHDQIKCLEFCDRIRQCGHMCFRANGSRKKCFEDCDVCLLMLVKVLQQCGHEMLLPCCQTPLHSLCKEKCRNKLSCGHYCSENCGTDCSEVLCMKSCERLHACGHPCVREDGKALRKCYSPCDQCHFKVDKSLKQCGHILSLPCYITPSHDLCKLPCKKVLRCGHVCQRYCGVNCDLFGCAQPCNKLLLCGHNCTEYCNTPCTQKCIAPCKVVKPCNHPCVEQDGITPKVCSDTCGECNYLVDKEVPGCKHKMRVSCSLTLTSNMCNHPCVKLLNCGHKCPGLCSQDCSSLTCKEIILKILPCGHELNLPCSEDPVVNCTVLIDIPLICGHVLTMTCFNKSKTVVEDLECSKFCLFHLPCGHPCSGACRDCINGSEHVLCKQICGRKLVCGHICEQLCHGLFMCTPCGKQCLNWCPHKKCDHLCGVPCSPCKKQCAWRCSHLKCDLDCNEPCTRPPCKLRCSRTLKCKHQCIGACGEACPKVCRLCSPNDLTFGNRYGAEADPNSLFILLEDCGHIFEATGFESEWMINKSGGRNCESSVSLPICPYCSTPIRYNRRISKEIKSVIRGINEIKNEIIEEFRTACNRNCITLREGIETLPHSEFHYSMNLCLFDIEAIVKESEALKLPYIHKLILLMSELCTHPSLLSNHTKIHIHFLECKAIYRLLESPHFTKLDPISLSELSVYADKCHMLASFYSLQNTEEIHLSEDDSKKLKSLFKLFSFQLKENPSDIRKPVTEHITVSKCFIYKLGLKYTSIDSDTENSIVMCNPVHCYISGWYFCERDHPFATKDLNVATIQCSKCNRLYL
ncbi:NFX1-type zinc finger-containing protein 1 [Oopsacas minuta]|uniref:NFX1-type zinc finger-containing protein 1 n=1 Tax=Oopsacas minuta TaxID=111878 RepID=A0AAV7JW36_9METZ|nr:NFX1-type zinc finger-containing protein 1 [Oopsacas minuta]